MAKIKLIGNDGLLAEDSLKAASSRWRENHPGTFHGMFSLASGDPANHYVSNFHPADYSGSGEIEDFSEMFEGCEYLRRAPLFDTHNGKNFENMFSNCHNLVAIPAYDLSSAESLAGMVAGCGALTDFACVKIGASLDLSSCREMKHDALAKVIGNLAVAHGKGLVLRLGRNNLAKLSDSDIAEANGKGWTLC